MKRNTKDFMKAACLLAAVYTVGHIKGHMDCLDKVQDKFGSLIPDEFIRVPMYGKCSLGVLNKTADETEEVTEDNVD